MAMLMHYFDRDRIRLPRLSQQKAAFLRRDPWFDISRVTGSSVFDFFAGLAVVGSPFRLKKGDMLRCFDSAIFWFWKHSTSGSDYGETTLAYPIFRPFSFCHCRLAYLKMRGIEFFCAACRPPSLILGGICGENARIAQSRVLESPLYIALQAYHFWSICVIRWKTYSPRKFHVHALRMGDDLQDREYFMCRNRPSIKMIIIFFF